MRSQIQVNVNSHNPDQSGLAQSCLHYVNSCGCAVEFENIVRVQYMHTHVTNMYEYCHALICGKCRTALALRLQMQCAAQMQM